MHTRLFWKQPKCLTVLQDIFPHGTIPGCVGIGHNGWYANLVEVPRFFNYLQPTGLPECRCTNTHIQPHLSTGPILLESVWVSFILFFWTKPTFTHRSHLWLLCICDFALWEQNRGVNGEQEKNCSWPLSVTWIRSSEQWPVRSTGGPEQYSKYVRR